MNALEKITETLKGKRFKYKNEVFAFAGCKQVSGYIMITTDLRVLQIGLAEVENFLSEIKEVFVEVVSVPVVVEPKTTLVNFEVPSVFTKLNSSFESLIDLIDKADDADISKLEAKAKMLTSLGQTAVNMENSKQGIFKALSGK